MEPSWYFSVPKPFFLLFSKFPVYSNLENILYITFPFISPNSQSPKILAPFFIKRPLPLYSSFKNSPLYIYFVFIIFIPVPFIIPFSSNSPKYKYSPKLFVSLLSINLIDSTSSLSGFILILYLTKSSFYSSWIFDIPVSEFSILKKSTLLIFWTVIFFVL